MAPALSGNDTDYGALIITVSWVLATIATAALAARFYSIWRIVGLIKPDFYIALVTWVIAIIAEIFLSLSVSWGLGSHISTLDHMHRDHAMKYSWIAQIMYIGDMAAGKLAIITALLQIRGPHDARPWFLWAIGATTVIFNGMTIAFLLAQCSPVQKLWDDDLDGSCNGRELNQNFAYFSGAWSAFCDVSLALYPTTILWKLQMKLKLKIGLCVLMGVGLITAVCSAIRTSELATLSQVHDITYYTSPLVIWTSTEVWVILILGSIPPIRPLFVRLFRTVSSSLGTGYDRSQYGNGGRITTKGAIGLSSMSGTRNAHDHFSDRSRTARVKNEIYATKDGFGSRKRSDSWENIVPKFNEVVVTTDINVHNGTRSSMNIVGGGGRTESEEGRSTTTSTPSSLRKSAGFEVEFGFEGPKV